MLLSAGFLGLALGLGPGVAIESKPGFAIVAPVAFHAALQPFVAARAREFQVELVALEDLVGSGPGVDPPERVKRHLHAAWRQRGLRYALLVGDADTFPVRFMTLDRVTAPAFDTAFYATDLYYADVADARGDFDDWNSDRRGYHARYFGEVCGEKHKDGPIDRDRVSYLPEIAVGRWPMSDAAGVERIVAKTLAWRALGAEPRVLGVHADGWIDARSRVRAWAAALERAGARAVIQLYGAAGVPSPASVAGELATGVDLAFHVGHGSNDAWHGCLGLDQRDALSAAHPAVFVSVGCSTAHFCTEPPYQAYLDEFGVPHRGTNAGEIFTAPPPPPHWFQPGACNSGGLGEALLALPSGGAVVYIGCDTGAQPCALTLLDGFLGALARDRTLRIGDAWRAAVAHYHAAEGLAALAPDEGWYPPSVFFQAMKFVVMGDPTLSIVAR